MPAHGTLAMGPRDPIIPASWGVSQWFVDPANSSGTASDTNDCETVATACLTYQEIANHRWGSYSPRLQQSTTVTWVSSGSSSDPVYFSPYVEGGPVSFVGTPVQVATGTITGLVAKNRITGQLLTVTLASGLAAPTLIKNTTRGTGAWLYKNISGSTWSLSQPLPSPATNDNITPREDDTWANGDSYFALTMPTIHVREIINHQANFANGTILIKNFALAGADSRDPIRIWGATNIAECSIQAMLQDEGAIHSGPESGLLNDDFAASFALLAGSPNTGPGIVYLVGGQFRAPFTTWDGAIQAAGDVIVGGSIAIWGAGPLAYAGGVYLDSGTSLRVLGSIQSVANSNYGNYVWGPGTLDMRVNGRYAYPAGAGQAAATFLGVTLLLNNQTKACVGQPGVASPTPTCNMTVTPTALDTVAGASPGCLFVPGGASFCNFP